MYEMGVESKVDSRREQRKDTAIAPRRKVRRSAILYRRIRPTVQVGNWGPYPSWKTGCGDRPDVCRPVRAGLEVADLAVVQVIPDKAGPAGQADLGGRADGDGKRVGGEGIIQGDVETQHAEDGPVHRFDALLRDGDDSDRLVLRNPHVTGIKPVVVPVQVDAQGDGMVLGSEGTEDEAGQVEINLPVPQERSMLPEEGVGVIDPVEAVADIVQQDEIDLLDLAAVRFRLVLQFLEGRQGLRRGTQGKSKEQDARYDFSHLL